MTMITYNLSTATGFIWIHSNSKQFFKLQHHVFQASMKSLIRVKLSIGADV